MPIRYLGWITRQMVKAEPEARFVFGDNMLRLGYGGQAAAMRDEPNAIGVVTKKAPDMSPQSFFSDVDFDGCKAAIDEDLAKIWQALNEGRTVYAPRDGLGTGLSRLPFVAPLLYRYLVQVFAHLPGERCPWELDRVLPDSAANQR